MNKYKEIFGVDISKDVFDVYGSKSGHNQFKNNKLLIFKNLWIKIEKKMETIL